MLHTTFAKAKSQGVCTESYRKMAKALGGITKYGKNTPIGLDKVFEVCGLRDTIWSLRCTIEPSENILIEFACQCAEHVLHIYENQYPEDTSPRKAIEAARTCITDKSQAAEAARAAAEAARAAANAAWAAGAANAAWAATGAARAAWAATGAARAANAAGAATGAANAAWVATGAARAAWDAEIEWQIKTLLELLNSTLREASGTDKNHNNLLG